MRVMTGTVQEEFTAEAHDPAGKYYAHAATSGGATVRVSIDMPLDPLEPETGYADHVRSMLDLAFDPVMSVVDAMLEEDKRHT